MGARLVLTSEDAADFERLKKTVHEGLQTFVEVGTALREIQERGLYKSVCATFEAWVQIEYGMKRSYAYETIAAAETVKLLSGIPDIPLPENVAQARPLTSLEPAEVPETWAAAVEGSDGEPTAEDVKVAVEAKKAGSGPEQMAEQVRKSRRAEKEKKAGKKSKADELHPFVQQMKERAPEEVQPPSGPAPEAPQAASTDGHKNPLATSEVGEPTGASSTPGPVSEDSLSEGEAGRRLARVVDAPKPYTHRMKVFVAAAVDAASATDEEIAAIPANDVMLRSLRNAREVLDRIIAHHSKERKHG